MTDKGGCIDRQGAGRHLRDGNDVGKGLLRKPALIFYDFGLNHRNDGIAAADTEKADSDEEEK